MTTIFHGSRSLEHGLFTVADETVPEDLPNFNPAEKLVYFFEYTMSVSAMHEIDGDALIEVQLSDGSIEPILGTMIRGEGFIKSASGTLSLYTASWTPIDELQVGVGTFAVSVFTTEEEYPHKVTIVLRKSSQGS